MMEGNDAFTQFVCKVFQYMVDMFPKYGWWLIGIIGLTVLLMIPVNLLVKKCFAKATSKALIRIRKAVSSLMVYVVAIGVLYLYQLLIPAEKNYNFLYVAGDVWSVGISSMATWWLLKLIWEVGFSNVMAKLLKKSEDSKQIKELIAKCGIDKSIIKSVLGDLEGVLKDSVADGSEKVDEYIQRNQVTLNQQAMYFLNAYNTIEKGKLQEIAKNITEIINKKHKIEK